MSQQMHSDEELRGYEGSRGYETSYTPTIGEPAGSYDRPYAQMPAQKIATSYSQGARNAPSAGQRLALAIVSMFVLLGSLASLSDGGDNLSTIAARLIGVVVVCIAAIAINFIFSFRR